MSSNHIKYSGNVDAKVNNVAVAPTEDSSDSYVYKGKTCKDWQKIFTEEEDQEILYTNVCDFFDLNPGELQSLSFEKMQKEVNKKFRQLSLKEHPDKSDKDEKVATAIFKLINVAKDLHDTFIKVEFEMQVPFEQLSKQQQEEQLRKQDYMGEKLRQQREEMKREAKNASGRSNDADEPEPLEEPPPIPTEPITDFQEQLEKNMNEARLLLSNKDVSLSNKTTINFWLMTAQDAMDRNNEQAMSHKIQEFNAWSFRKPAVATSNTSASAPQTQSPDTSVFIANQNDPRFKVLELLITEQQRLMKTYHLTANSKSTAGVVLISNIETNKNGKPYYKEGNKTLKIARQRLQAITTLAEKLESSLKKYPDNDNAMKPSQIYAQLNTIRKEIKSTGLIGIIVTGRTKISQAMQIVGPDVKDKPKAGLIENIKSHFRHSK